jgi:hypothetical protein
MGLGTRWSRVRCVGRRDVACGEILELIERVTHVVERRARAALIEELIERAVVPQLVVDGLVW